MRFTYDPRYNVAYIRFQTKRSEVETIQSDLFRYGHPGYDELDN